MRRPVIIAMVLLVLVVVGIGDHVLVRQELGDVRRENNALNSRLAKVEQAADDDEEVAAVKVELAALRTRVAATEKATARVCIDAAVNAERARLDGANAGSNYTSSLFYTTVSGVIDAICGAPS